MKPCPVEVSPDSGGIRQIAAQGSTGPVPQREDVFDGEDRYAKSDPITTVRCGMDVPSDKKMVDENNQLKS